MENVREEPLKIFYKRIDNVIKVCYNENAP